MSKELDRALEEIAIRDTEKAAQMPAIKPGMVRFPLLIQSVMTLQRTERAELIPTDPDA